MQRYYLVLLVGFVCFSGGVISYTNGLTWPAYILTGLATLLWIFAGINRPKKLDHPDSNP